ncbi:MAG: RluA family pseudouridine synthase [Candidatus Gottesmanbacteria bacterium]
MPPRTPNRYMKPQIVFEDESLLVIDKPSGMVVNKADTTKDIETVQDWVEKYMPVIASEAKQSQEILKQVQNDDDTEIASSQAPRNDAGLDFYKRGGIVHRLDKETSGLLLIAKTPAAFVNLQAQFKNREVKKKYLALVHGKVIPEEGEINAPIGRLPWNRERFGVVPGGREALTKYKIVKYYTLDLKPYTLIELYPQTGRTHQIRVHLKYIGFPIVGDSFYAGRKQANEDRKFCPRVFLHASHIEFTHPITGGKIEFDSPLPQELEETLNKIKN